MGNLGLSTRGEADVLIIEMSYESRWGSIPYFEVVDNVFVTMSAVYSFNVCGMCRSVTVFAEHVV